METASDVTRCVIVKIRERPSYNSDELRTVAATALREF